jgi:hypothetical protein
MGSARIPLCPVAGPMDVETGRRPSSLFNGRLTARLIPVEDRVSRGVSHG